MSDRKKWSDLSQRHRRLIIGAATAEGLLRVATLIDIRRRPAAEIRGPKWAWAVVVGLVSSGGVVPACYYLFGRRRDR
ncbi:MAG: hypothetical protein ACLQDY_31155 [Streptosporangiaceae bacterium]